MFMTSYENLFAFSLLQELPLRFSALSPVTVRFVLIWVPEEKGKQNIKQIISTDQIKEIHSWSWNKSAG